MASSGSNDGALSKTLLQMKFMQKTASKLQQEVEEEEIGALEEQWVIDSLPAEYLTLVSKMEPPAEGAADHDLFEYKNSITVLEQLAFGRMSFQGMNPEVEALMRNEGKPDNDEPGEAPETSVTDEDMAQQYSSFVKNMDKKFKTKRQRQEESSDDDDDDDDEVVKKQKTPNKIVGEVKSFLKPKEYQ